MKTAVRLLVHETCNRFCGLCCNQSPNHNLNDLPILQVHDMIGIEEVILTGGEPMLDPLKCIEIIRRLKWMGPNDGVKFYMYTAHAKRPAELLFLLQHDLDGVTLTLHKPEDVYYFMKLQDWLDKNVQLYQDRSLRLNYFVKEVDLAGVNTTGWEINPMYWLEDCPLPENEIFRRWAPPTDQERKYRNQYYERNSRFLRLHEKSA